MIKVYQSVTVCNTLSLVLPFGQAKVNIDFEGGNVSRGKHATYYTNDPFRQRVLDKSSSNGVLYRLVRTIPEEGDEAKKPTVAKDPLEEQAEAAAKAAYMAVLNGGGDNKEQKEEELTIQTTEEPVKEEELTIQTIEEPVKEEGQNAPVSAKGTPMKDMEFADASEVIIYVMQNYGEQTESLDAATKILRKHKINPVIK